MKDLFNVGFKAAGNRTLGLLKRAIPGDFREITDVCHPALDALDIDMGEVILPPPCPGVIAKLWACETVPVRTSPFNQVLSSKGDWAVVVDPEAGAGSLSSLWFFCFCDSVLGIVKAFEEAQADKGNIMLFPYKEGMLIALDGFSIKALVKKFNKVEEC